MADTSHETRVQSSANDADNDHDPQSWSFVTNFDIKDTADTPQLGIHNNERVNRPLITRDAVSDTSFSAMLHRVQYGSYEGQPACLVVTDFSFRFVGKTLSRYTNASIEIKYTKAADAANHKVTSPNPNDDAKLVNMAPKEVYGIVKTVEERKYRDIKIPVMFQAPMGLSASLETSMGSEETEHHEHRMEIHGNLYLDDDHDEAANGATWDLTENSAQRDGIFRSFRAAMVLCNPPGQAMWMHVTVKPSVRFSLNPQRLFDKTNLPMKLLQKNDEPVLLDGKTPKGEPVGTGIDFSAPEFPWAKVIWLPAEYKNQLMSQLAEDEQVPSDLPGDGAS